MFLEYFEYGFRTLSYLEFRIFKIFTFLIFNTKSEIDNSFSNLLISPILSEFNLKSQALETASPTCVRYIVRDKKNEKNSAF